MATRRVTGSWRILRPDGTRVPGQGTVTFKPSVVIRDSNTSQIVVQDPIVVTLSTQGTIDVQLQTTDQEGLNPTGWFWEVTEEITSLTVRRYQLDLPAGGTLDLSTVAVPPTAVPLRPQDQYLKRLEIGETNVLNPNQTPTVSQTTENSVAEITFSLPRAGQAAVGTVTQGTPAQGPAVTSSTTAEGDPRFSFRLPRSRDISAGVTVSVDPDQPASVSTVENPDGDVSINFSIPRAAEVTVGTVTVFDPDQSPDVLTTVTDGDVALDFGLPRAPSVSVGSVTTSAPGSDADVTDSGANGDVVLDFTLPRGIQGPQGDKGELSVGTVTVVNPDQNPTVTNSGTSTEGILDFDLPRAPSFSVGTVTTGAAGSAAAVTDVGTDGDITLDFSIPQGIQGEKGDKGDKGDIGAGLNLLGTLNDPSELPLSGELGDAYIIGSDLYVWEGSTWNNVGQFVGPQGEQGPQGIPGVISATAPITYDSGTQTVGFSGDISDLSDVDTSGAADGEVLTYSSGSWSSQSLPDALGPILLNSIVIDENYVLPSGYNGLSAGPVNINPGVTVSVPAGAVWAVV